MYRPNAVKTSSAVTESLLLVLTAGRFLSRQIEEFGNLSASAIVLCCLSIGLLRQANTCIASRFQIIKKVADIAININ